MITKCAQRKRGYALLVTILLVSAFTLAVGIGMSTRARSTTIMDFDILSGKKAQTLAYSCADYALLQMAQILHYNGNEGIMIENSTCTIESVQDMGGAKKLISVHVVSGEYTQRVSVAVNMSASLRQTVWWRRD